MKELLQLVAILLVAVQALDARGSGGFYTKIENKKSCPFPVEVSYKLEKSDMIQVDIEFGKMNSDYLPAETILVLGKEKPYRTSDLNPPYSPEFEIVVEDGIQIPKRVDPNKEIKNEYGKRRFSFSLNKHDLLEAKILVTYTSKGRRSLFPDTDAPSYLFKITEIEPVDADNPVKPPENSKNQLDD